jgi:hypothetical protein
MKKKYKKPNLGTVERALTLGMVYTAPNGDTIRETGTGYFMIVKDGISRTHDRLVDCWRSL